MHYLIDHQQKTIHETRFIENRCHIDDSTSENKQSTESKHIVDSYENQLAYIPCPYCYKVPLIID